MRSIPLSHVMRRTACLIAMLACSACVSIPLATVAKLALFDEQDFVKLDPSVVSMRVTLPKGFILDPAATQLAVTVTVADRKRVESFALKALYSESSVRDGGLFASDIATVTWVLKLSEPSKTTFAKLQKFLSAHKASRVYFDAYIAMSDTPEASDGTTAWVDLLLTKSEGWFVLIDGGRLDFDKPGSTPAAMPTPTDDT